MKNKAESFGRKLREEREKRGLSLREASAQIGISHTYLSSLEKGRDFRSNNPVIPSPEVVFKISKAYGIDFVEMLPLTGFHDEKTFFRYVATQIRKLKETNPRLYKQLLEIITEEKDIE